MSNSNSTTQLTGGVASAAFVVSAGCLGVSVVQASQFILQSVPDPVQRYAMVAGICFLLLGSQVIARMLVQMIKGKAPTWSIILCLFAVAVTEMFSISTSTTAFDGNLIHARRNDNVNSTEYKQANSMVESIQADIRSLRRDKDQLPANYVTKKQQLQDRIDRKTAQLQSSMQRQADIDVSASGAAFDRMEERTGVGQADVALLFACLLSLIPIACNLGAGALASMGREVKRPKKQKPHLQSVKTKAA